MKFDFLASRDVSSRDAKTGPRQGEGKLQVCTFQRQCLGTQVPRLLRVFQWAPAPTPFAWREPLYQYAKGHEPSQLGKGRGKRVGTMATGETERSVGGSNGGRVGRERV